MTKPGKSSLNDFEKITKNEFFKKTLIKVDLPFFNTLQAKFLDLPAFVVVKPW